MLYMNDIFKKIGIWLAILPIVYTTTLNAQDYSDDKERIARIEGVLSKLPKMSGFVNLRYVYDNLNNNNSFDVRRARLDFRGDISEQFAYRLQVEFANNPIINYSLGLFNGSGINTPDNNKSKDFSGILTVNPLKYLSVAGYHYNGSAVIMGDNQERVRTGFGTKYDYNQWLLRGEYIIAETGDLKSEVF